MIHFIEYSANVYASLYTLIPFLMLIVVVGGDVTFARKTGFNAIRIMSLKLGGVHKRRPHFRGGRG
jgi:hypothetical protein